MQNLDLRLLIGVVTVASFMIVPINIYGQSDVPESDTSIGWKIKTIIEDIWVDNFIIVEEKKAEELTRQANSAQREIELLTSQSKPIPRDVLNRVDMKLEKAKIVLEKVDERTESETEQDVKVDNNGEIRCITEPCILPSEMTTERKESIALQKLRVDTDRVINDLENISELNEIKLLVSQVQKVSKSDQSTKDRFNQRVNALNTWNQYCIGEFNINNYLPLDESAIPKLEKQCPKMKELNEKYELDDLYLQYRTELNLP